MSHAFAHEAWQNESPRVGPSGPAVRHVIQGNLAVSADPNLVLTTILGSCIAACLWDPERGVGGLNHFLLPGDSSDRGSQCRYGAYAMELLINEVLRLGARRCRLRAKLFGGAKLLVGRDVGQLNAEFAAAFLANEGITQVGGSVRGNQARRIQFWPATGRARQFLLPEQERPIEALMQPAPCGGDVELF